MKNSTKNIIKAGAGVLALALIVSSIFLIRSCSTPPAYEEISERAEELIEKSFDVNDIVWGEGLPTYERVETPTLQTYEDTVSGAKYYYNYLPLDSKIIKYRKNETGAANCFAYLSEKAMTEADLSAKFPSAPLKDGEKAPEGLYSEVYSNEAKTLYAYLIPYEEPEYGFQYTSTDDPYYDCIRFDVEYPSVESIKEYVRTVYAVEYADSIDSILFDGVVGGEQLLKARYSTITFANGEVFAKLNTYEPLFTERRVYLYNTAKIDRANSNKSTVVVEYDTYMPSTPKVVESAKITFVLCDGVWYLASPTY